MLDDNARDREARLLCRLCRYARDTNAGRAECQPCEEKEECFGLRHKSG